MAEIISRIRKLARGEAGTTMVEYGLMLALIALLAMGGAALIGTNAGTIFSHVGNSM
jgi:pilus assembly protein Flp/PilA